VSVCYTTSFAVYTIGERCKGRAGRR